MHHLIIRTWHLLLVSAFLFPALRAGAQLPASGVIIENGVREHDAGNYKKALEFYRQVPDGDTNYATAVYEMTLSYLADSAYQEAKQTAFRGLELKQVDWRGLLLSLAHAYDYLGMQDSAIYYYDSLVRLNPTDHQPWYEKGVLYAQQKMYDTAIAMFRKSLMINPYHFRSHLSLGSMYMMQGRLTESFIALQMSLLMTSNAQAAGQAIQLLGALASQTDEVSTFYRQKKSIYSHPVFDETDRIINARLVLDKGYKLKSALSEEQIVRVAHMIMDQVAYDKEDPDFVMQYYVPLLQEISRNAMFDEYMLLLFSGYEIKVVDQLTKGKKYNLEKVKQVIFPYYEKVFSTRKLNYTARATAPRKYLMQSSESRILSGNLSATGEPREGMTRLYQNHYLVAEGKYNKNNKREGAWKFYNRYGRLRAEENYENGIVVGKAQSLYSNGLPKSESIYNEQGEMISEKGYSYDGILRWESVKGQHAVWKKTSYYKGGAREAILSIKDDKVQDGSYKIWYEHGGLYKDMNLVGDELDGAYSEYHENNAPALKTVYAKGKLNGPYQSFYENGKPKLIGNYKAGELAGPYEKYDEDGSLMNKCIFKNGKMDGIDYWYHKGKEYARMEYKDGIALSSVFMDTNGKVISDRKGPQLSVLQAFRYNGSRDREFPMRNGAIHGEAKFYFATGKLRESVLYEKDQRSGKSTEYFQNGKVSTESFYKKGRREGLYKGYFSSGRLQATGYLINGEKEGVWTYYASNGTMIQQSFYIEDERNGTSRYFHENGTPDYCDLEDYTSISGVIQYDSSGKVWRKQIYSPEDKSYQLFHWNSKVPRFEAEMRHGKFHGAFKKLYPDGKVLERGYYRFGRRDSSFTTYHYNGQTEIIGFYKNGSRQGLWTFRDEDGRLTREINYENGEREGLDKTYNRGILRFAYNYQNDERSGDQFVYSDSGVLALILRYTDGLLIAYSNPAKDGQAAPFTAINEGSAEVITFYPDGTRSAVFRYKDNEPDGVQLLYYRNGKLAEEHTLAGGDYNGTYRKYYPNGKRMYEAEYRDDNLDGTESYYDMAGQLIRSRKYSVGFLHGAMKVKDKSGKQVPADYYYGIPVHMGN